MSWIDEPFDMVKIMGVMFMVVMMLALIPKILDVVRDGVPTEDQGQYFNLTVISKRIEYERGFFAPKRTFILILSDGELYRVPEKLFDVYDTGDPITIEIRDGKVIFS